MYMYNKIDMQIAGESVTYKYIDKSMSTKTNVVVNLKAIYQRKGPLGRTLLFDFGYRCRLNQISLRLISGQFKSAIRPQ